MKFSFIAKSSDYRLATFLRWGKPVCVSYPEGTRQALVHVALPSAFDTQKHRLLAQILAKLVSLLNRYCLRKARYLELSVEHASGADRRLLLLNGFSSDTYACFDLLNAWCPITTPLTVTRAGTWSITASLLDARKNRIAPRSPAGIMLSKPIFRTATRLPNILYVTLEGLTDISYLQTTGLIGADTHALYREIFSDFQHVDGCLAQNDWTFPAAYSYFTGLLCSQHLMFDSDRIRRNLDVLPEGIVTVAQLLKQRGYITCSASLGKLRPANGFGRGFDSVYKPVNSTGYMEYFGDDKWVMRRLMQFRDGCFVHLHLDRLHAPYVTVVPEGACPRSACPEGLELDEHDGVRDPHRLYERNLRALLHELDNVVRFLRTEKLWAETLVIVTADHGADLPPWLDQRQSDPLAIDLRVRVPYLINKPADANRNASVRGIVDICRHAGVELPSYLPLLPQFRPEYADVAIAEAALKTRNHLYVLHMSHQGLRYVLHARVDWASFKLLEIVKECVFQEGTHANVTDQGVLKMFTAKRELFFRLNQDFLSCPDTRRGAGHSP